MYTQKFFESEETAKLWIQDNRPKNHAVRMRHLKFYEGTEFIEVWIHPVRRHYYREQERLMKKLTTRVNRLERKIRARTASS